MFTYKSVKKYLFERPIDAFGRNRVPSRCCHSQKEKKGIYRHHGKFFYPPDIVVDIEVCQDASLQQWLDTLDPAEKEELIKGTQYWEDMRSKDLMMRQHLKFHWKKDWDQDLIKAVGILKYRPQSFGDFVRECLEYCNQLFVQYGVMRWLRNNLYERYIEMKKELKRQREEIEEAKAEQQRKKRRITKEETSDTEEETTDEEDTEGEE